MVGSLLGLYQPTPVVTPHATRDGSYIALEARIDALELACAGLWEMLKSKHGYSDEEIVGFIHQVDARDGKLDGKAGSAAQLCPSCGRKLITRSRVRCVWCGAELPPAPFAS
jgi:hypothetical protein